MSKAAIDIDKIAREAQRKQGKPSALSKLNDNDIPYPLNWQIIVEPVKPKEESRGGIVIASEAQEAEHYQINLGIVRALGQLALRGTTASGLDLSIDRGVVQIGTYVMWQRYTGLKIKVQQDSGEDRIFLAVQGEDLVCIPRNPERIRFWI